MFYFLFVFFCHRCGTKPDMHGQFYENTVVVQYDKDLLEVWDEAKRLRCEWFNDYEKTASKPPMVIADLDVIQLDFRGIILIFNSISSTIIFSFIIHFYFNNYLIEQNLSFKKMLFTFLTKKCILLQFL